MPVFGPTTETEPYYECLHCDLRITEELEDRCCPECGGYVEDLTVERR